MLPGAYPSIPTPITFRFESPARPRARPPARPPFRCYSTFTLLPMALASTTVTTDHHQYQTGLSVAGSAVHVLFLEHLQGERARRPPRESHNTQFALGNR